MQHNDVNYQPNGIAITGIGLVSSLGLDVATSAASYRAGLTRVSRLEYFTRIRQDDGNIESPSGHAISIGIGGFQGNARLLAISRMALTNLSSTGVLRGVDFDSMGITWALPNRDRTRSSADQRVLDAADAPDNEPLADRESIIGVKLVAQIASILGSSVPAGNCQILRAGHAGAVSAIHIAVSRLRSGAARHWIVAALDSLLEEDVLEWLDRSGRLKTEDHPVGLMPGEAGAYILIERLETALVRDAEILAVIGGSAVAVEKDHLFSGEPASGTALSEVLDSVLAQGTGSDAIGRWIISDHSGDTYRAQETGFTLSRLCAQYPSLREAAIEYPAIGFGDTGAASGGVAICTTVRAFVKGYASSPAAVVLSSADWGERGALLLRQYSGSKH